MKSILKEYKLVFDTMVKFSKTKSFIRFWSFCLLVLLFSFSLFFPLYACESFVNFILLVFGFNFVFLPFYMKLWRLSHNL